MSQTGGNYKTNNSIVKNIVGNVISLKQHNFDEISVYINTVNAYEFATAQWRVNAEKI